MTAGIDWTVQAADFVLDTGRCPVCAEAALDQGHCLACGVDLSGTAGRDVLDASTVAARALRERERLLRAAHLARAAVPHTVRASSAVQPAAQPAASVAVAASAAPPPARAGATLQSVIATAGAALFAVAAIVFVFFNPDLTDRIPRSIVIAVVTLVFLAGAWALARRRLRFSAEAVGGLGLVFLGLDVHSFSQHATALHPWASAALGTAVVGIVMLFAALRARIRIWLWTALLGLAAVPGMLGLAVPGGFATALGSALSAFAATGLCAWIPRLSATFAEKSDAGPARLRAEVVTLTALQLLATASAVGAVLPGGEALPSALILALLAGNAVLAARHLLPRTWAVIAGVLTVAAGAIAAGAVAPVFGAGFEGHFALASGGAALAFLVCALVPLPPGAPRRPLAVGALIALAAVSVPSLMIGLFTGVVLMSTLIDPMADDWSAPGTWSAVAALAVTGAGLLGFGFVARRRAGVRPLLGVVRVCAAIYLSAAALVLVSGGVLPRVASIVLALGMTAGIGAVLWRVRGGSAPVRMLVLLGGHLALAVAVVLAWGDRQIMPLAGLGVLAALWALAQAVRRGRRFVHVGAGYGYALLVLATALSLAGIDGIAQLCLTASVGLVGAIAVTFLPAIGARNWQAVLLVATVPFAIGVVQVVFERSGWTALSTGLMFLLALSLLLTRRPGLTGAVRTLAAGMLVPTLAVVLVCLGAQLLPMSGSPVVLPVIAVVIALVLPSGILIRDALVARGRSTRMADAARVAIEASSLLTAVIAVALAFTREAAGPGVACLVLLILGIGAVLTALVAGRRYGWVLAGASFTGALWSLWWLAGVELPEAYLLPPTLGAALVGVFLTLRGVRAAALFTAALVVAIVPLVVLVAESEGSGAVPWRAYGLLAAGGVLAAAAALLGRGETARLRRLQALRVPTALAAGIAAPAGTIQAVRWGVGADTPPAGAEPFAVFLACLAISVLSALVLASAAAVVRGARAGSTEEASGSRWLTAPAVLALAVGVWPAIERDWPVIWAMWTLMIVALVVVVIAASRRRTSLPPVWFLFGVAFVTGVVAWSPRDLRVEWFSLPMGAFLLLAGAIGLRAANRAGAAPAERRLGAWPHGWGGSWALLAPGIVVTVSASIVATFTDPLTWRAILVMVLALAAILVGASRRLAAPFLIGLVVLPIENVFVFSVQLGRNIEAMPWWITLALMGAVLLIIAVAGERREGAEKGVVARVRDLR